MRPIKKVIGFTKAFIKKDESTSTTNLSKSKLFRLFVTHNTIIIGVIFILLYAISSIVVKQIIDQHEKVIARAYNREIENALYLWLENHVADISMLQETLELETTATKPYAKYLSAFAAIKNDFSDVFIANSNGSIYVTTTESETVKIVNISDRDYFRNAKKNGCFISGFFRDRVKKQYFIAISIGLTVQNQTGITNGVLVGLIPVSTILSYLQSINQSQSVVNVFVIDNDFNPLLPKQNSATGLPQTFITNMRNATTHTEVYTNSQGDPVYGTATRMPDLKLILVTELNQKKSLESYNAFQRIIIFFAVVNVILLLCMMWLLTKRLLLPIKLLSDAAMDIAHGIPNNKLELNTGTELDTIGSCFSLMSSVVFERESMLREAVARDSLTGLYNHGRVLEFLTHELIRQSRDNKPISFIMLDIDFFKHVNDKYGHQAGDFVLKQTASLLADNVRESDILGRYGGEEFALIVSDETEEQVVTLCERIRQKIDESNFVFNTHLIHITVSIGYCYTQACDSQPDLLIRAADSALYTAKGSGRNKVCSAPISST